MPLRLYSKPRRAARRQRQHAVAAVERLNGGLFVDAKHGGVARRVEIETDDVGRLAFEVGIVGSHVALQTMGLEIGFAPDAMNEVLADAEFVGEFTAGPMSGAVAGLAAGGVENLGAQAGGKFPGRLSGPMGFESVKAVLEETFLPLADGGRGSVEFVGDGLIGEALGQQQYDLGPRHEAGGQRLRAGNFLELGTLSGLQSDLTTFKRHIEKTSSL